MTGDDLVARLRAAGCVFAEDEAAALREAALREAAGDASASEAAELDALVARRIAGEPLEIVVGYAAFAGLRIPTAAGVFVPRARTVLVARLAATLAPTASVVVDLCCGSGAIAAAVAHARPDLTVVAADIDPVAVALATRTLAPMGATAMVSDMDAALPATLRGAVAVLASCPPYVPTAEVANMPIEAREHEPLAALDGGPEGTALQARVFEAATRLLAPGGICLVETSEHLADATLAVARATGLLASLETDDDVGAVVVIARR